MKCSYCGSEAIYKIVPEEKINFRGKEITLKNIKYKCCTNSDCKEPIWLCGKEGVKRENQIRQQLGEPLLKIE